MYLNAKQQQQNTMTVTISFIEIKGDFFCVLALPLPKGITLPFVVFVRILVLLFVLFVNCK